MESRKMAPGNEDRVSTTTPAEKDERGMNRRQFMTFTGLGALAGLSLVTLGGCDNGDGSGGDGGDSQDGGATTTAPMVEKTVTALDGFSTYVIVKFSTLLDTSKRCYRFTWNPIPVDDTYEEYYSNKGGKTYLTSKYTNAVAYAGTVTVQINTPGLGCSDNKLLGDLYGNKVPPYTKTVTFA